LRFDDVLVAAKATPPIMLSVTTAKTVTPATRAPGHPR